MTDGTDSHPLRRKDIPAQALLLAAGRLVYAAPVLTGPEHVRALQAELNARGMTLAKVAPFHYEVTPKVTANPLAVRGRCSVCSGETFCSRCRRCGTRVQP